MITTDCQYYLLFVGVIIIFCVICHRMQSKKKQTTINKETNVLYCKSKCPPHVIDVTLLKQTINDQSLICIINN